MNHCKKCRTENGTCFELQLLVCVLAKNSKLEAAMQLWQLWVMFMKLCCCSFGLLLILQSNPGCYDFIWLLWKFSVNLTCTGDSDRVVREASCMLGFDTSRASSDSRGCPAAPRSRVEVSAVVTWSPSAGLAMAGQLHLQTWLPSADSVKHNLWTGEWKESFLLGTSALTWSALVPKFSHFHCLNEPVATLGSRTFTL